MAKHVHADLIHAYANGAKIQVKENSTWEDISHPQWFEDRKYRIKPRKVKREGWVNVYPVDFDPKYMAETGYVFDSYDTAIDNCRNRTKIATVKIEWEEEQ